ncbi:hypothetical protein GG344DRAFT_69107 [Lentinula edodes]|nr:hypothetical protein GG344DRAFT_69107 [Lentinula edodes]
MTKLLFVLLILFVPQIGPGPNPINATSVNEHSDSSGLRQRWLHSSSSDVLWGFRYVAEWKAKDYNYCKTLTAIPAMADMIGEGAYLSPVLDQVEKYKGFGSQGHAMTVAITRGGDNMLGLKVWCMQLDHLLNCYSQQGVWGTPQWLNVNMEDTSKFEFRKGLNKTRFDQTIGTISWPTFALAAGHKWSFHSVVTDTCLNLKLGLLEPENEGCCRGFTIFLFQVAPEWFLIQFYILHICIQIAKLMKNCQQIWYSTISNKEGSTNTWSIKQISHEDQNSITFWGVMAQAEPSTKISGRRYRKCSPYNSSLIDWYYVGLNENRTRTVTGSVLHSNLLSCALQSSEKIL